MHTGCFTGRNSRCGILFTALLFCCLAAATSQAQTRNETTVHDFPDPTVQGDGRNPYGTPVYDASTGNLYGTTVNGGKNGRGTIYCYSPNNGFVIVHSFGGADGADPTGALTLVRNSDGFATLYGVTLKGGRNPNGSASQFGVLYRASTSGVFAVIHNFLGGPDDGANPYAPPTLASDGNLYGTTVNGGTTNRGTIYCLKPPNGKYVKIHDFGGQLDSGIDGFNPYARLLQTATGDLVGTTISGGETNLGVVFDLSLKTGAYSIYHTFSNGEDGSHPAAPLIQVVDDNGSIFLYGTTTGGGPSRGGTAYRLDTFGGEYSVIHSFGRVGDGAYPWSGLLYDERNQLLYGTTRDGGVEGDGSVFKMRAASPAAEAVIHSFDPFGFFDDGSLPYAGLVFDPATGLLYGACSQQGAYFDGTLYSIKP